MQIKNVIMATALLAALLSPALVRAGGGGPDALSGYVAVEASVFAHAPNFIDQEMHSGSISFKPEYYREWNSGYRSLTFTPYIKIDSADPERTHFDVRELFVLSVFEKWELGIGARKVYWGMTETQQLVDIINQTDLVDAPDGEEKLGQPMINVSIPSSWGIVDAFLLPYFRERTFPGKKGRLRTSLVVDTDQATYASDAGEFHPDLALRWSHSLGDWELAVSWFTGTGRAPSLSVGVGSDGAPALVPHYDQIDQGGVEVARVWGDWLFKFEGLVRGGPTETYGALTGGFEYTFANMAESGIDLGILSEWLYDDRGDSAPTPFENDIAFGFRLAFNDIASTEALLFMVSDFDTNARSVAFESSRRFGDHLRATFEARVLIGTPDTDPIYDLRDDDLIQLELAYYF